MRRPILVLVVALLLASCGETGSPADGNGTGTTDGESAGGSTPAESSQAPAGDDILSPEGIAAAYAATEAQGSWMFEAAVFTARSGGDLMMTGTERRQPVQAVSAQHSVVDGDFQYVRIEDDIWYDVAIGEWTHIDAGDAGNLIDQYEPYHLAGLVAYAYVTPNDEYEFVAEEDANGVRSRHYRLSEADREHNTQALGLGIDDWAGDVWIASDGGYLVRYVWGPQSMDLIATTGGLGFSYDVLDAGCSCPVDPPV